MKVALASILIALVGLMSSGARAAGDASAATGAPSFAYDRSAPLGVREVSTKAVGGVTVRDLTYAALDPRHGRIAVFLVKPAGAGPFPGILYFHWLGEPRGDRTEFLDEAIGLARGGAVSLLIQGYFPWREAPTGGRADRQQVIDQTMDTRRAMDLLLSQPEVDAQRVGFVGHDYGAMYGAIMAGLERRAKAYVFVAGMGNFGDWSLKYWPDTAADGEAAYRGAVADVDPINYVGVAAPAALLFQFARRDTYIPEAVASEFFDQASSPKEVRWYDAGHDLQVEAAAHDRREWLARQLKLASTPLAPRVCHAAVSGL